MLQVEGFTLKDGEGPCNDPKIQLSALNYAWKELRDSSDGWEYTNLK